MIDLETLPPFYQSYVKPVAHLNLLDALHMSQRELQTLLLTLPETKGAFRYAPGKWTVKEVLCHIMDAERIFCYRALRFSRNDKTILSGFEENDYATEANAEARTVAQLAIEMQRLRSTTIDLYNSFTKAMLSRTGTANNTSLSVYALGYIIAGHETHHRVVLQQRYLTE